MGDGVIIVGIYIYPKYSLTTNDINTLMGIGQKIVITGDFNATHPSCECRRANPSGNRIYRYLQGEGDHDLNLLYAEEPTFYPTNGAHPSTLHFVLVKGPINITNIHVEHEMNSDHLPVIFNIPAGQNNMNKTQEY